MHSKIGLTMVSAADREGEGKGRGVCVGEGGQQEQFAQAPSVRGPRTVPDSFK